MSSCVYSNQWLPKLIAEKNQINYPQNMKNKQACSVPGCKSDRNARGVRYPEDEKLCQQWIDVIQIDLSYLEVKALELRVCHVHFHQSEFYKINNGLAYKVKNDVVPSLNLPIREETSTLTATEEKNGQALVLSESCKEANAVVITETVSVSSVGTEVASHQVSEGLKTFDELNAILASVGKDTSIDELRIKFDKIKRLVAETKSALRSVELAKRNSEIARERAESAKKDAEMRTELAKAELREVHKKYVEEKRQKHFYMRLCRSQSEIIKKQNKEIPKLRKYKKMMKAMKSLDDSQLKIVNLCLFDTTNSPIANLNKAAVSSIYV